MTSNNAPELRNCPFCGGKARYHKRNNKTPITWGFEVDHWVSCTSDDCCADMGMYEEKDQAIAAWNCRTAQPAEAGRVSVKPLEWVERDDIQGLFNAESTIGWWYNVQAIDGGFRYEGGPPAVPAAPQMFPSLEAAKAAAQADYEQRILAALAPAPAAPVKGAVTVEEAAQVVMQSDELTETIEVIAEAHQLSLVDTSVCVAAVLRALAGGRDEN